MSDESNLSVHCIALSARQKERLYANYLYVLLYLEQVREAAFRILEATEDQEQP
jgi:hypothetical protein